MSDPAAPTPATFAPADFSLAEDQAIDWAILLADDPHNSEQVEQFNLWLAANPLHQQAWMRTQTVYAGLDKVQHLHYRSSLHMAPSSSPRATQHAVLDHGFMQHLVAKLHHLLSIKVLGGGAIVACLFIVALPSIKMALSADFRTGTNQLQTHQLEDGSKIFLAPETAVDIHFSDKTRTVNLLKGKVFFEVQSNPARPFQVNTTTARVTVLGTAFDVDNLGSETVISVAHGRVQVDDKTPRAQASQQLGVGDQLIVSRDKTAERRQIMLDDVARWRERELVARDMAIDVLIDALRPYYQGVIIVQGEFAQTRVTGLYRLNDPVATLTHLAHAQGIRVRQISPWVLLLTE